MFVQLGGVIHPHNKQLNCLWIQRLILLRCVQEPSAPRRAQLYKYSSRGVRMRGSHCLPPRLTVNDRPSTHKLSARNKTTRKVGVYCPPAHLRELCSSVTRSDIAVMWARRTLSSTSFLFCRLWEGGATVTGSYEHKWKDRSMFGGANIVSNISADTAARGVGVGGGLRSKPPSTCIQHRQLCGLLNTLSLLKSIMRPSSNAAKS